MTRDDLLVVVQIHHLYGGSSYVVLAEIPASWRDQFGKALSGSAGPRVDGAGYAWAWDSEGWVMGRGIGSKTTIAGPKGLARATPPGNLPGPLISRCDSRRFIFFLTVRCSLAPVRA